MTAEEDAWAPNQLNERIEALENEGDERTYLPSVPGLIGPDDPSKMIVELVRFLVAAQCVDDARHRPLLLRGNLFLCLQERLVIPRSGLAVRRRYGTSVDRCIWPGL